MFSRNENNCMMLCLILILILRQRHYIFTVSYNKSMSFWPACLGKVLVGNIVSVFKTKLVRLISLHHSWKTFLLYSSCVHTTLFISVGINIQKAKHVDFCAINIFLTCECSSGYLLLLCHNHLKLLFLIPSSTDV